MFALLAAFAISPTFTVSHPSGFPDLLALAPRQDTAAHKDQEKARQESGRILSDVFRLIDEKYVRDLGSEKLFESGIKALLQGVDPHTMYFNPEEAQQFRQNLKDRFGGIGVVFNTETPSGYPMVHARFFNAPAARAGIQKGDLIVNVDDKSTRGWKFEQIADRLMGPVGSTVRVTVRRNGVKDDKTLAIRRGSIRTSSVRGLDLTPDGQWLDKDLGIGYIRMTKFAEDTVSGFRAAHSRLVQQGARALVIDLRGNFGGLLAAAVQTADLFVDSGLIVRSVGRDGTERRWMAHRGEDLKLPIAVLINEETASSAEVFSACLQDHHRALMVGVRSYGKGSIQQLFKVGTSGAMVKLTTAHYFPASGRNIDKLDKPVGSDEWGISPDRGLEVKLEPAEREAWAKTFFEVDNSIGTDIDLPPYDRTSDKVLVAARAALKEILDAK